MGKKSSQKETMKYVIWNPEMDRVCIDTFIEEYHKGGKGDNGWKSQSYRAVITAMNEKLSMPLSKDNIRSRLKTWRKSYMAINSLIGVSGFGWNDAKKMVEADDITWKDYIMSHPDAAQFRSKSFHDYDDLSIIIGKDQAHGGGALTGIDAEIADEQAAATEGNEIHDVGVGLENTCENEVNPTASSAPIIGASSSGVNIGSKKKKRGRRENVMEELSTMNENLKIITEAIQDSSESVDMDRLITTLMTIPDFDDRLILESAEFLSAKKKRADMFFRLDEDLRKKWLLIRLRDA